VKTGLQKFCCGHSNSTDADREGYGFAENSRAGAGFSFDAMRGTRFNPGDGTKGDHP
jgi:hypothetical protein